MGFNYSKEKRRFNREWLELRKQYKEAGFSDSKIQELYDFDLEVFRRRRTYENSVQPYPTEVIDNVKNHSSLFQKFSSLTVNFDESSFTGRYDWIETISDSNLLDKLIKLSNEDKELLTLLVFDGYSQTRIAELHGCTKQSINKKFDRIKKFLKQG